MLKLCESQITITDYILLLIGDTEEGKKGDATGDDSLDNIFKYESTHGRLSLVPQSKRLGVFYKKRVKHLVIKNTSSPGLFQPLKICRHLFLHQRHN